MNYSGLGMSLNLLAGFHGTDVLAFNRYYKDTKTGLALLLAMIPLDCGYHLRYNAFLNGFSGGCTDVKDLGTVFLVRVIPG